MCREVGDEVELLEPVLKFWIHCAKLQLAKRATLKKKKKKIGLISFWGLFTNKVCWLFPCPLAAESYHSSGDLACLE